MDKLTQLKNVVEQAERDVKAANERASGLQLQANAASVEATEAFCRYQEAREALFQWELARLQEGHS